MKDDYKPYSAKRWTEIPIPKVTGHIESTPEERERSDSDFTEVLKEYGVIGKDEIVKDGKVIKVNTTSQ